MGCTGIQVQPGCCCTVAFETTSRAMVGPPSNPNACLGNDFILNALDPGNIDLLPNYRLLFLGPISACGGTWYSFTTAQNLKIKAWVEAGGRLFAAAEYLACFDSTYPVSTPNFDRYNTFLGFLGSAMQMSTDIPNGCNADCNLWNGVARPVPIMSGITGLWHGLSGKVTGGTQVCRINAESPDCNGEVSFINAERIGDGIVFACIDSNVALCGARPTGNCEFFQRVCNWPVSAML